MVGLEAIGKSPKLFWGLAGGLIVLGLALRILGARGDLWEDEITTLKIVSLAHSPWAVFCIPQDNNHFLNSLYLYFTGPDASTLIQRAFSIFLGTLTIIAAGLTLAPAGRGATLLGMLLFAVAFAMVNFGSEARGYAGLSLCTVLAIHYLDQQLDGRQRRWQLGAAICAGVLFHLTMVFTAAALALYVVAERWRCRKSLKAATADTIGMFLPSLYLFVPFGILLLAGIIAAHGFHFGYLGPFEYRQYVIGYGGMIKALIGPPQIGDEMNPVWPAFCMALAVASALLCLGWRQPGNRRAAMYAMLLIALPLVALVLHVPNTGIRRYFLSSGTAFLLCVAELGGQAWTKGPIARAIVIAGLSGFLFESSQSLTLYLTYGKGHYADAVKAMTAAGPASYGGMGDDFNNLNEVQFYAGRLGVIDTYVPQQDYCATPPAWLIDKTSPDDPLPPDRVEWGPAGCRLNFADAQVFPAWGMSGSNVTLYRRVK